MEAWLESKLDVDLANDYNVDTSNKRRRVVQDTTQEIDVAEVYDEIARSDSSSIAPIARSRAAWNNDNREEKQSIASGSVEADSDASSTCSASSSGSSGGQQPSAAAMKRKRLMDELATNESRLTSQVSAMIKLHRDQQVTEAEWKQSLSKQLIDQAKEQANFNRNVYQTLTDNQAAIRELLQSLARNH